MEEVREGHDSKENGTCCLSNISSEPGEKNPNPGTRKEKGKQKFRQRKHIETKKTKLNHEGEPGSPICHRGGAASWPKAK